MELLSKGRSAVVLSVLSVVTLILVSFLILDCTRLLQNYPWSLQSSLSSAEDAAIRAEWASNWPHDIDDAGESLYKWSNFSTTWWNDVSLHSRDPNWRGRMYMHEKLKDGSVWYDENVRDHFISSLEDGQFPSNCTKNTWIVHREHDSGQRITSLGVSYTFQNQKQVFLDLSVNRIMIKRTATPGGSVAVSSDSDLLCQIGLLSCAHVFFPIFSHGLGKGNGYTMIPVGQAEGHYPKELPTFDGCGERKNRNLRCFFNITSCNIEDDPVRLEYLHKIDKSKDDLTGLSWVQLFNESVVEHGMIVFKSFQYDWRTREQFHKAARGPRLLQWNAIRSRGKVRVYGKPETAIEHVSFAQIDFVIHSMLSAWMIQQTSKSVKSIANGIMAKYADASGRPLWTPPVLAVHVRQTDKEREDPYFREKGKYRSVGEYAVQIDKMEKEYGFKWESLFLISDSGTAIESLAQEMNGIKNNTAPDSENGGEGKRFIMYDWSFDIALTERMGGHTHIPPDMKYSAQEHFLATLYIIGKIADYAVVQYSSNVGRFISELIGARHRLSSAAMLGPNAFSIDGEWFHD